MKFCMNCGSPAPVYENHCPRCASLLDPSDRLVGVTLADKYLIEERIGSGGMCVVYRARHTVIGKRFAVKVLKPELAADPKIASQFEHEARAASRLRHPNAVDVNDYGIDGATPFIVMGLVEGESLGDLMRRTGPLPVERTANILRQTSAALDAAHSVSVIHRDIKPDNLLISEYEGSDWVVVLDFGVARIQEDMNRRAALTGSSWIIGTPRYMSPEQCDEKPVDFRSDIYSLGVVLYEMLAGRAPFEGSAAQLMKAHMTEPPPPLRQIQPDLSPEIEAVVMQALEKDPDLRPQSAGELSGQFEVVAGLHDKENSAEIRAEPSTRISVPLADHDPLRKGGAEESTLVRMQSPSDLNTPSVNTSPIEPAQTSYNEHPPPVPSDASGYGEKQKKVWPIAWLMIVLLAVAGVIAYMVLSTRTAPASEPGQKAQSEAGKPQAENRNSSPPAEEPPAESQEVSTSAPESDLAQAREQIRTTLTNWTGSLENRNLEAHINHYAPRLERYYLKTGVSRDFVRSDRARALSIYSNMDFKLSNVEIAVDNSGRRAVVTFDKRWNFSGQDRSSGKVQERVWLARINETWKIIGERDLKVYSTQ